MELNYIEFLWLNRSKLGVVRDANSERERASEEEVCLFGKFYAKLMEVWLGHKVAVHSLADSARDSKQDSSQKKPQNPAKSKWFPALRMRAHILPPNLASPSARQRSTD